MTTAEELGQPYLRVATGQPGRDREPSEALGLALDLRDELSVKAVRYCHWKSNDMLARSMDGRNDLDLLVHRRDAQRFLAVLARLGFHRALAPAGREHPGVAHYYGLDRGTGRLVHVHAHFQLVLGDDATKNFRLPVEEAYLASARHDQLLPVPAPEFELALFVVRMMLKHATWDAAVLGNARLGEGERRELAWLVARADPAGCRRVVAIHLPYVGADLWGRCLASLTGDAGVPARLVLGRRLMAAIRAHGRRPPVRDTAVRILRRGQWAWAYFVLRRPARKKLERTGLTVGVVGGDGAGKSTAVDALADWLDSTFVVHRTHLGRPRPSLLTLALKGPMFLARRAGRLPSTARSVDPRTATAQDFPGAAWALWHVLTARDRRREYRRLRRVADAGGIVVSDRWPLPQLHLMDGSRVAWVLDRGAPASRAARWLAATERRLYADIAIPDVLVVLRLDPEIAVERRPEDDPAYLRSRNGEVFETDWTPLRAVVVDAAQPPEQVLAAIRGAVWDRM
ncbi:MAG: hypothetical protein ACRDPH_10770 [Marmoricola sp.]